MYYYCLNFQKLFYCFHFSQNCIINDINYKHCIVIYYISKNVWLNQIKLLSKFPNNVLTNSKKLFNYWPNVKHINIMDLTSQNCLIKRNCYWQHFIIGKKYINCVFIENNSPKCVLCVYLLNTKCGVIIVIIITN